MMIGRARGPDRVQAALESLGLNLTVQELPDSTRTAREAAEAVGCTVGQIAKSLVFVGSESGRPYLVIASGANRVDEGILAELVGEEVKLASPDYVRQRTSFAIGGVPPVGHPKPLHTFVDQDLLEFDQIWAAAGAPRAVFAIEPQALVEACDGQVVRVADGETG